MLCLFEVAWPDDGDLLEDFVCFASCCSPLTANETVLVAAAGFSLPSSLSL